METATSVRDLLFTLLLKVGVASSIAALLARWNTFRRVLFTEQRDPDQKLKLMLFMTPALIVGETLRLLRRHPYRLLDLSRRRDVSIRQPGLIQNARAGRKREPHISLIHVERVRNSSIPHQHHVCYRTRIGSLHLKPTSIPNHRR
jgi:hypothetical protein